MGDKSSQDAQTQISSAPSSSTKLRLFEMYENETRKSRKENKQKNREQIWV